jgi:hypothetical protein
MALRENDPMGFAEYVQPLLGVLKWLCYIVLLLYLGRVLVFIFRGKSKGDPHRLREAMAMAYTVVAAYFIFRSADAIQPFVVNIVEAGGLVHTPTPIINIVLIVCAGIVCTAFICNFSRSLWMLKSLDHGIFEPVPEWEDLLSSLGKRAFEFTTRTIAALLFIALEFRLERLASGSAAENVNLLASGATPRNYLTDAGRYGLYLYFCLCVWWFSGLWVAKRRMPRRLLAFYTVGLINSAFIFYFGGKTLNEDWAMIMLLIVVLMGITGLYMLFIVLQDFLPPIFRTILTAYKYLFPATVAPQKSGG